MFTNDFNPFEVLEKEVVKQDLKDVIEKTRKKKSFSLDKTVSRIALLHLAHLSTAWVNALGVINEWQDKRVLKKFHIAQLNYLFNHPRDLKSVLEANLAICAIILYHSYSITQLGKNVSDGLGMFWYALKNLSFEKGLEESRKEVESRMERNMWNILLSPIVLLMNQKYTIKKNEILCDTFLSDIVEEGCMHSSVDSLCTEVVFKSFMTTTILLYFKNRKYEYKKYIDTQSKEDICDIIDCHINFFLSTIERDERIGL